MIVDGFLGGMWRITRERDGATLVIETGGSWSNQDRAGVAEEGARMLAFLAPGATGHDVHFTSIA